MARALAALVPGLRLPYLAGAVLLAAYALIGADAYALRLLTIAGSYALMVIGYQLVFGHAGALSLAQGAFFGIGAYVTAILADRYGLDAALTLPLSALVPALLAAVVAAPVLRLESHYFALATLGIAQLVLLAAVNWEGLTGGANGLPGIPTLRLAGLDVERGLPLAAAVWAAVAIGGALAWRLTRGRTGRALAFLRAAPLGAAAAGIDAGRLRFAAFLASAAYGGAAGAFYIHAVGVVSPEAVGFPIMVACLSMAVIGGRLRIAGAVLAALLLIHLPEFFRFLERHYLIAYGAATLAVIVFAPSGLIGAAEALRRRLPGAAPPAPTRTAAPPPPSGRGAADVTLRAEALVKRFGGVLAVDGVDLAVRAGEIVGLMGPNGSGKTTLANLIGGFERPDSGRVRLASDDLTGLAPFRIARAGIGRSFQTPALPDAATAREAVAAAFGGDADRAVGFLDMLDVGAAAAQPCGALPHGVRRRVEIARALAADPAFLVLDEPAAGLTGAEARALAARLQGLAESGLGLLVIEHDMPFLLGLADRVVCLDRGRVLADGAPDAVRRDPRVVAAYLGPAEDGR